MLVILFVSVHVVKPPSITSQVQELKDTLQGKCVKLTIQATGTEPLSYQWQWKPAEEEGGGVEWQPCPAEWSDGAAILIPIQKSSEWNYRCVISNCTGSQTSEPVKLNEVG